MAETLTYETLYEILRKERIKQELQNLEKTFYRDVNKYIKDKVDVLETQKQKSSIFAQKEIEKTEKQLDNVKKIIRELYEKRELKIVQLALSSAKIRKMDDLPELLPEEKVMFEILVKALKIHRENIINNILEKPKDIKIDQEVKLIRFTQAVPKFMADDNNEYGPFEEEYIALLPSKVVEILIKNNRAELI